MPLIIFFLGVSILVDVRNKVLNLFEPSILHNNPYVVHTNFRRVNYNHQNHAEEWSNNKPPLICRFFTTKFKVIPGSIVKDPRSDELEKLPWWRVYYTSQNLSLWIITQYCQKWIFWYYPQDLVYLWLVSEF